MIAAFGGIDGLVVEAGIVLVLLVLFSLVVEKIELDSSSKAAN